MPGPRGTAERDDPHHRPEARLEAQRVDFAEALAHFSRALSYELRGDTAAALREYRAAIDRDPDNETLHMLASRRLLDVGKADEAIELMVSFHARHPRNERVLLWLSQLELARDDEAASLAYLLQSLEQNSDQEAVYREAIRLFLRQQRPDKALELSRRGMASVVEPRELSQLHAELLIQAALTEGVYELRQALMLEARDTLKAAIARNPGHLPLTLLAVRVAFERREPAEAMALYRAYDLYRNRDLEVRNTLLVHLLRTLGSTQNANAMLMQHLTQQPGDALAHFFRGMLAELANRSSVALTAYRMALENDPEDIQSLRKLAVLHLGAGDSEEAVRLLQAALTRFPDEVDLLTLLGGIALSREEFSEAARVLRRLDQLRRRGVAVENPLRVRTLLAMAALALGEVQETADVLTPALREERSVIGDVWQHQIRLAFLAGDRGSPERSARIAPLIAVLELLSNRLPEEPEITRFLGRTHQFEQNYPAALAALQETRRIAETLDNPEQWLTADFFFDLAASKERSGIIEPAKALFKQVIDLDPDHALALNYLAYMWAERGMNLEQALEFVGRALAIEPNNGAFLDTRGWALYKLGRFPEAYRDLRRASELEPEESVIAEHMGAVLMRLDRPVEAVGFFRIALALGAAEREALVREALDQAEQAVADLVARHRQEQAGAGSGTEEEP